MPPSLLVKWARLSPNIKPCILRLKPQLTRMPLPIQRFDDPFLPFGKAVINATRDHVAGYLFSFPAYLAIGAAGIVALERTIAYVQGEGRQIVILDLPAATPDYAAACSDQALNADGLTVASPDLAEAYAGAGVVPFMPSGNRLAAQRNALFPAEELPSFMILGDEILYAGNGEDFQQQITTAVIRTLNEMETGC